MLRHADGEDQRHQLGRAAIGREGDRIENQHAGEGRAEHVAGRGLVLHEIDPEQFRQQPGEREDRAGKDEGDEDPAIDRQIRTGKAERDPIDRARERKGIAALQPNEARQLVAAHRRS